MRLIGPYATAILIAFVSSLSLGLSCEGFYSKGSKLDAKFFRKLGASLSRQQNPGDRPDFKIEPYHHPKPWITREGVISPYNSKTNQSQVEVPDGKLIIAEIRYVGPIRDGDIVSNSRYESVLSQSANVLFENAFQIDLATLKFK